MSQCPVPAMPQEPPAPTITMYRDLSVDEWLTLPQKLTAALAEPWQPVIWAAADDGGNHG